MNARRELDWYKYEQSSAIHDVTSFERGLITP